MLGRLRDSLRRRRVALALAAVAGVLYFVGFCGYDQWYLSWFCLVPVLWALDDATLSGKEAAGIGWLFGQVAYLGGYSWITGTLRDFGGMPLPLAMTGWFLLCLAQSSLFAFWGWLLHRVRARGLSMEWAAPATLVVAEWLWPALFPTYLSNSQYRQTYFIQSLDLWGPLGLTFIVALASAVLYQTLAWRPLRRAPLPVAGWAVLVLLVGGNLAYGVGSLAAADDSVAVADRRIKVGVVQTNMGIYEKHSDPGEGLRRHREQSLEVERQGADLIVWPESGYNRAISDEERNLARRVLGSITTPLLFGGLRVQRQPGKRALFNTAFLTDGDGNLLGTYDKVHLLAFGEYLPFGDWFPWLYDLAPHTGRFTPGSHSEPLQLDGVRYGVLVCYEDVLPRYVRDVMQHEPDVLVNITNDAWYGRTNEPTIHLALAVFRAVEHRRFLVRATNTGISAIVGPGGRILADTPVFARANLVETVVPLTGRTLYARLGDWVGVLFALVSLVWLRRPIYDRLRALGRRLRRRAPEPPTPPPSPPPQKPKPPQSRKRRSRSRSRPRSRSRRRASA